MTSQNHSVVVAVLDTGIVAENFDDHAILPPLKFSDAKGAPDEIKLHGTAVASTILTIAPNAKILPVHVTDKNGQLTTPILEDALHWLLANHQQQHIKIICAAFADYTNNVTDERYKRSKIKDLIAKLRLQGVITVAATGNWHHDFNTPGMGWPAILRDVVSVGSLILQNSKLLLAENSQRLNIADGTGCYTTVFAVPDAPYDTSGATAVVVGKLAKLCLQNPELNAGELIDLLLVHRQLVTDKNGNTWPYC